MADLPVVSGKEALRTFEKAGWAYVRRRGSHMIMTRSGVPVNLCVPDHDQVDRGTLRKLIRLSRLSVEEFVGLLKE